ncbi:hypothetical protein RJ639_043620 [Escallonia herrerae]|uniref:BZIP domain-containing protein n=1 Tax=Escallonia herrerae TaxID=1293975 RepID=A0AA88WDX3_9ASTE|nr:hypothetical protein RJ639_043620 [Escallonia herrerae]
MHLPSSNPLKAVNDGWGRLNEHGGGNLELHSVVTCIYDGCVVGFEIRKAKECKNETRSGSLPVGETDVALEKVMGVNAHPTSVAGKVEGTVPSPSMSGGLQTGSPPSVDAKTSMAGVIHPCAVIPNEAWLQNERELKRERRKQSNRESARRSRLRKQAEAEELAIKVESLTAENMTLKSEINCVAENSRKLKLENATLMEKLKSAQPAQAEAANLSKVDEIRALPLSTANLLSRVNNSASSERSDREGEIVLRWPLIVDISYMHPVCGISGSWVWYMPLTKTHSATKLHVKRIRRSYSEDNTFRHLSSLSCLLRPIPFVFDVDSLKLAALSSSTGRVSCVPVFLRHKSGGESMRPCINQYSHDIVKRGRCRMSGKASTLVAKVPTPSDN